MRECLVAVLGNPAFGAGTGTYNDPFESEWTDPETGVVLVISRWQSVNNDPPIVVGDTTYHSFNVRQKEFSYLIKTPYGVPIFVEVQGEFNEYTTHSRVKTDANGNQERIRDYLKYDLSSVENFPVFLQPGNVRKDDRYKWVHDYTESSMDINPSQSAGTLQRMLMLTTTQP